MLDTSASATTGDLRSVGRSSPIKLGRSKKRYRLLGPVVSALLLWSADAVLAASSTAHVDKTIQYTFRSKAAAMPAMRGEATMGLKSKAQCAGHGIDSKQPAEAKSTWQVSAGQSAIAHPGPALSTVQHASAMGQPAMKATAAQQVDPLGDPTKYRMKVTHTMDAQAAASKCPSGVAMGDPGEARVRTKVTGAKQDGWDLRGKVNGVEIPRQTGEGTARAQVTAGTVRFLDPLWVSVTDMDTSVQTTEELFALAIVGESQEAPISFEYDLELGLTLSIGRTIGGLLDGSLSVAGSADSSWLDSPFGVFGASLDDGLFSATGVWADKPWVLTHEGADVVSVHLDAAFLPAVFDYRVPDSVIASDNSEYQQDFEVESELTVSATELPEPTSLSLLALGGMAILRRRRA